MTVALTSSGAFASVDVESSSQARSDVEQLPDQVPLPVGANPSALALDVGSILLESGTVLPQVIATLQTWGHLSESRDNVILVEHALTGDSHVVGSRGPGQPTAGWWPELIGQGAPLDPNKHFVVSINMLGGCRGTTGPSSPHPVDGAPWGSRWPRITIRDQVEIERRVLGALGVERVQLVLGGSMGGMRVLEWIATYPGEVDGALPIATTARATADQIAWGHAQTLAITNDPDWCDGDYERAGRFPAAGLGLARRIAHTTYRSADELQQRFGVRPQTGRAPVRGGAFAVQSYLDHQAAKLVDRFDAGSYVALTDAMATHDLTRGRGSLAATLASYGGVLEVAAVNSDRLFPVQLSQDVVDAVPQARLAIIESMSGHDGFLIETDQIDRIIRETLRRIELRRQAA